MTLRHKIKLIFARVRWTMKRGEKIITIGALEDLLKECEAEYNEGYRKNPTNHDVLRMQGKVDILKQILHG